MWEMPDGKQEAVLYCLCSSLLFPKLLTTLLPGRWTSSSLLTWDFESIAHPRTERKCVAGSGAGSRSPVSLVHHHTVHPCLGLMGCDCFPRVTSPADGQGSCLQKKLHKRYKLLDVCLCRLPQTPAFPAYVLHVRARTPWSYADATKKKFGLVSSGKAPTLK